MPKLPGGITKSKRQEVLRRVLKRWGRLNKQQIDQYVSSACGCDAESISRSLYRDLDELSAQGDLKVFYFTRDGIEIDDYDPETHKNTYCEWATLDIDMTVVGGQYLNRLNIFSSYSKRLEGSFYADSGEGPPIKGKLNLYFLFEGKVMRLLVDPQSLPISIMVARRPDDEDEEAHVFENAEVSFGKRLLVVLVPTKTLSSPKGKGRLGHFLLRVNSDNQAAALDLGSKNGTNVFELSLDQTIGILEQEVSQSGTTRSLLGNDIALDKLEPIFVSSENENQFKLPLIIEATRFFRLVSILA